MRIATRKVDAIRTGTTVSAVSLIVALSIGVTRSSLLIVVRRITARQVASLAGRTAISFVSPLLDASIVLVALGFTFVELATVLERVREQILVSLRPWTMALEPLGPSNRKNQKDNNQAAHHWRVGMLFYD